MIGFCVLWGAIGCSGSNLPANTPTGTPLPVVSLSISSATPTPRNSQLVTATTAPVTPATPTKAPTLSPAEAEAYVLDLFENNNGCQLPCWWGITPGQTEWLAAQSFLQTFAVRITSLSTSDPHYYGVIIPIPPVVSSSKIAEHTYIVRDGYVEMIEALVGGEISLYSLSTILNTYGQPTEIWLSTYDFPRGEGGLPFAVLLFYPEQGMIARFDDIGANIGEQVRGCPQGKTAVVLAMWNPALKLSFREAVNRINELGSFEDWDYLKLEESTDINVETFYQTFRNPDNTICLETPAILWHH
jgi:hypothetical protein